MPQHCVVRFCATTQSSKTDTGTSLHRFPKDPALRAKWINFVRFRRQNWTPCVSSAICSLHFTSEDSVGVLMKKFGCRSRVFLKPGAVPTIQPSLHGRIEEEEEEEEKVSTNVEFRKKETSTILENLNQTSYQPFTDFGFLSPKKSLLSPDVYLVSSDPTKLKTFKLMEWLIPTSHQINKVEEKRKIISSSIEKMVRKQNDFTGLVIFLKNLSF